MTREGRPAHGSKRHIAALVFGLIAAVAWAGIALAEAEWQDLAAQNDIRLMRHSNRMTGKESCWIQAMFRAKPDQRYLFGVGFAAGARFKFHLQFPDRSIWLETSGHVLSLADGRRFALSQMEMGSDAGEGLSLLGLEDQDVVVRALIEDGQFSLTYRTLDGVHRSRGDFDGLRAMVETATRRCKDARRIVLP